jgi:uncharacterized protein (TIGR02996 family)
MTLRAAMLLAAALASAPLYAQPFVPVDDSQVLETLPEQRDRRLAEVKRLQRAAREAPGDLSTVARFVRSAIEASRATGDPRYAGWAQSALQPWATLADPPAVALLLRATLRQGVHDFTGALADLDRLVAIAPRDSQARATRATVLTVLGRYSQAILDCDALAAAGANAVSDICRADIEGRSGRARQAYARLQRALASSQPPEIAGWAHTMAAEIAGRLDDRPAAERHFVAALAADPDDAYARGAYADWLLDRGRAADVVRITDGRTRNDALMLRRVLALAVLPETPAFAAARADLAARVDASRRRGDGVHRREEARYALEVERDVHRALRLARENWNVQREPADLRILALCARAAGDAAALRDVRDWLRASGLEDARLAAMLDGDA